MKLLVIDDSLTIRKLVELSFRESNDSLEFAASGSEGIERALAQPPTAILLDYILPDMRGTDVCAQLANDERTAGVPIVVMTAKSAQVKPEFDVYSSVKDFITKPFAAEDVVTRVRAAAEGGSQTAAPVEPGRDPEAAALALYTAFRRNLARIPEFMASLGDKPASAYFGRKIITPRVVEETVAALAPIIGPPPSSDLDQRMVGDLSAIAASELLELVARAQHTGVVEIAREDEHMMLYFWAGDLVLATCTDPERYHNTAELSLDKVSKRSIYKAKNDQRATGRPLYLSLAEDGQVPLDEVHRLVTSGSRRVAGRLLDGGAGRFTWPKPSTLPTWVGPYKESISLAQMRLDQLRQSGMQNGTAIASNAIIVRQAGFSKRVARLRLEPVERQALSLVDGRLSADSLVAQLSVDRAEGMAALARLVAVDVISIRTGVVQPGPVVIYDPDGDGVVEPLRRYLRNRDQPLVCTPVDSLDDMFELIEREAPSLCIIHAAPNGKAPIAFAKRAAELKSRGDFALLATLDLFNPKRLEALSAAGFDRVAPKPMHVLEIEQLLDL